MEQAAKNALITCMGVKKGEEILIVTDVIKENIGRAFFNAAKELGAEAVMIVMLPREISGEEPPKTVADAMLEANVVIAPTFKSISHTEARRNASKNGARIATLPGITEEMMKQGAMKADYRRIEELGAKLLALLKGKKEVKVTSPNGTNLTFDMGNMNWMIDTGIAKNPGDFTNLPGGEVYIAPYNVNGTLVVDGAMSGIGKLDSHIKIEIKNRRAVSFEGEKAKELEDIVKDAGESGRNIAELGIGTNEWARLIGITLEDEKVAGTIHVALGDNASFGGDVVSKIHLDGIVATSPRVFAEGEEIILPKRRMS